MPTFVGEADDERETLLLFLDAQRGGLRRAALGLTEEQARQAPTTSALSVAGLIKHNTQTERNWIARLSGRHDRLIPYDEATWADSFRLVGGETLDGALESYEQEATETERIVRGLPGLDVMVAMPDASWCPPGSRRSARWILLHLIEEAGRHAGHADIIREALDGRTAFELVAAEQAAREA